MKLSNKVYRFQEGGAMPAEDPAMAQGGAPEEGAPMGPEGAPQGGEDEMMAQIGQMADEVINQMGPDAAAMLAQAIMERLQGGAGEQQLPPEEAQPAYARRGGRLVRVRG